MEDLTRKLDNIESALCRSRKQLLIVEKNTQLSIGDEIDGMRDAITVADSKILFISSKIQDWLRQIDAKAHSEHDTTEIDLKAQMPRLNINLTEIVSELEVAQSRAGSALEYASNYTYQVLDVGQEVEINRSSLAEAQNDSELLASKAQSEFRISETLLATTQSKIIRNENDYRTKTLEAEAKRRRKAELESELSAKSQEISVAKQAREKKNILGAAGTGLGVAGLILTPFTFGISFALVPLGATAAGIGFDDASNLKAEVRAKSASVDQLRNESSSTDREVLTLERENHELRFSARQYKSEVDSRKKAHEEYRGQIQKASAVQNEILSLQNRASATSSHVTEAQRELQQIKAKMDECCAVLVGRSLEVQNSSTSTTRLIGKSHQSKQEFKRQKNLVQSISKSLESVRSEMRSLPSSFDAN